MPVGPVHLPGHGGGQPIPQPVRTKMEAAFGVDFSSVRIHEGPHAEAVGALAYTQGTNIHFAPGQYQPTSQRGQELLGHELTHVVQQSQGRVQATTQAKGVNINDDASLEREADELGAKAARGAPVSSPAMSRSRKVQSGQAIQRQSIHNPLFPCFEASFLPGSLDFFGTLVHLAIQQHYIRNIDPLAATEYVIPGSGPRGGYGRADIVSAVGGVYEIKPLGLVAEGFTEALAYVAAAEALCDPAVDWHLGFLYYPPPAPMIINGEEVISWLYGPGVIAYVRRRQRRQRREQRQVSPRAVPQVSPRRAPERQPQPRSIPQTQPQVSPETVQPSTRQLIVEFARRVYEQGLDATQAAEQFFREHPGLVATIAALGVVAIIALIADDASLVGIADDVLIPIIAKMEWVALRLLVFG